MKNQEIKSMLKYYFSFIAMSFIPILIVSLLLAGHVSELVLWVVTASIMLLFVFIGLLYRPRYLKKQEEKKKNNIDPFK